MRQVRWLLLLLATASLAACEGEDRCQVCTEDKDCRTGLACVDFVNTRNGEVSKRCGQPGDVCTL